MADEHSVRNETVFNCPRESMRRDGVAVYGELPVTLAVECAYPVPAACRRFEDICPELLDFVGGWVGLRAVRAHEGV